MGAGVNGKSLLLEVKNLKTHFHTDDGVVKAVDGVSFDLDEGEILGIVGESGCGKSVTAFSIIRLIPDPPGKILAGEVVFEGRDLLKMNAEEIRQVRGNKIAMIFQEPMTSLNPVLTIGHQLSEPLIFHRNLDRTAALREAVRLLGLVQIPDGEKRIQAYPHQFSGGMRQRAMVAMGLGCRPKLIIADEPTTALDVTIQAQLLDLMKKLTEDFGTALIIITHNLGVIARYADRVNVMYAGKIVERATARDLYANPRHPYTIGLLASVPRLDQAVKEKLIPIEGQPPDLVRPPSGCPFHPRCVHAREKCRQESQELRLVANQHYAACWRDLGKR
jgi:oligopeptide/dipeptide ABC transporter ATP-binding protein